MSSTAKVSPKFVLSPSAAKLRLLKKLRCTLRFEKNAWASGAVLVAGVDEVGRGSLFGPVVAAAVILERGYRVRGLRDSKLLLPERRELLAPRIREHAVAWAVAAVDAARIDQINIYQASRLAMREAGVLLQPPGGAAHSRTCRCMGGCGGGCGSHRPDQHLPGVTAGYARGGDAVAARGRSSVDRCRAPRLRTAAASHYSWRRAFRLDCGGFDSRQSRARPYD